MLPDTLEVEFTLYLEINQYTQYKVSYSNKQRISHIINSILKEY
jgi:hypothetical protein